MPTLHWIGKEKVINHHLDIPYHTLNKAYTYDNGVQQSTGISENKIIHADNLLALKSLLPEYEGRIKCIYIDPPYNTGNESWVYNDNVSDPRFKKWLGKVVGKEAEDLTRHDKWLCMMYPRLKLLHKLLSEDGAIFISIDDNEQASLKMMMDEIFGAGNMITSVIWQRTFATKNDAKHFSSEHEYIFVFTKKMELFKINLLERAEKQNARYTNFENDPRGPWTSTDLLRMEHRDNSIYSIISPLTGKEWVPQPGTSWRHPENEMMELIKNNEVTFGKDGNSKPRRKRFLKDVKQGIIPQTIWKHEDVGHTQDAKQTLKKILDASTDFFATPKPVKLIEQILKVSTSKNSIILDSFAGSGTTAHSVLSLNKQDGGNRKFILIEMEDYAETITAERVKRVIKGYGETERTGGNFNFYNLGERVLDDEQNLNPNLSVEKINNYIWYSETHQPYTLQANIAGYLGKYSNTGYYFYYQSKQITTLDDAYLMNVTDLCEQYVIYADICLLSERTMLQHNIIFKKIPRDISKL